MECTKINFQWTYIQCGTLKYHFVNDDKLCYSKASCSCG